MEKIVLIEDDLIIRKSTVEILELAGYKVYTSLNSKEGIKQVKEKKPDIILCGISMSELNGFEVFRILNRIPKTAKIPFIFLSSSDKKDEMRKAMSLGADDYLAKPFREIDLLDAIQTRINKHKAFKGLLSEKNYTQQISNEMPLKDFNINKIKKIYLKNEVIFKENDFVDYIYYILKGKVKRVKTDSHGKEFLNDIHTKGDFFGYLNFFKSKESKHKRTAIAVEETELALIPKKDFNLALNQNKDIALIFIKNLSGNVLDKEDRLIQLAYSPVRERVANVIIKLKKEDNINTKDLELLKISRNDLANIVGTSKESLIRTLSEFKKEKIIDTGRDVITILNKNELYKIASGF
jgi:CRP-like cAMP-binding protein